MINDYYQAIKRALSKIGLNDYLQSSYDSHANPIVNINYYAELCLLAHQGSDILALRPEHSQASSGNHIIDALSQLHLIRIVRYMSDSDSDYALCYLTPLGNDFIYHYTNLHDVIKLTYDHYDHVVTQNEDILYHSARKSYIKPMIIISLVVFILCGIFTAVGILDPNLFGLNRIIWLSPMVVPIVIWIGYMYNATHKLRDISHNVHSYQDHDNDSPGKQYSRLCNFVGSDIFAELAKPNQNLIRRKDMLQFVIEHNQLYQSLLTDQLTLRPLSMILDKSMFNPKGSA